MCHGVLCDRMKVETEKEKPVSAFFKSMETQIEKRVSAKKKRKSQEREIIKKQIYRKTNSEGETNGYGNTGKDPERGN